MIGRCIDGGKNVVAILNKKCATITCQIESTAAVGPALKPAAVDAELRRDPTIARRSPIRVERSSAATHQ